ncbi:MAG: hypothetical protein FJ267_06000 [Planctomycetes bacterium]|nr:hypothetical protein [Planctomycetota bacterium]
MVPLVSMNGVFLWSHRHNRTSHSEKLEGISNGMVNVIVLHGRGKTLGLSVDSLVGRGDMVIKSLSENFVAVRGLSGASILGDGSVCLMLDSSALIELASSTNGKKELTLER